MSGTVFVDGGAPGGLPAATAVSLTDHVIVAQGGAAGIPGTATDRAATLSQIFGGGNSFPPLLTKVLTTTGFDLNTISGSGVGPFTGYIGFHQITNQTSGIGAVNFPAGQNTGFVLSGFNSNPGWDSQLFMGATLGGIPQLHYRASSGQGTYAPWSQVITSAGGVMNGKLSFNTGLNFGSNVATGGVTDLTRHIALWDGTYGFSITDSRLNYVANVGATHAFVVGAVDRVTINSSGLTVSDVLNVAGASTLTGPVTAANSISTPLIANGVGATQGTVNIGRPWTMSGAFIGPAWLGVGNTITGTTTQQQSQLIRFAVTDTVVSNAGNGGISVFSVEERLGAGWGGSRVAINGLVSDTAATTLGANKIGLNGLAVSQFNSGGVAAGYGVTQFGQGNNFGAVIGVGMGAGATFYRGQAGLEIDVHALAGSNSMNQFALQIVHDGAHAVSGQLLDVAVRIGDQVSALVGWKTALMTFGSYDSQWPLGPNGYLFQVQNGENHGAKPVVSAGGFDLNQLNVAGTGAEGGGFFWRSPGVKVHDTELEVGYGSFANDANGMIIDSVYKKMNTAPAAITVANGGANFTSGDLAADAFGNIVQVTASVAGVVTGISAVLTRAWRKTPPVDPVPFTTRTRTGPAIGSGLTLNLGAWTALTRLTLQPSGGLVTVAGATTVSSTLNVTGATTLGAATVGTTLAVTGTSTFSNTVTVPDPATAPEAANRRYVDNAIALGGGGGGGTLTSPLTVSANPGAQLTLSNPTAGLDLKNFDFVATSGQLTMRGINDAKTTSVPWLTVNRSTSAITSVQLSAPTFINVNGAQLKIGDPASGPDSKNFDFIAVNGQLSFRTLTDAGLPTVWMQLNSAGTTLTDIRLLALLVRIAGKLNLAAIPTTTAGLAAGDVWRNGTVLNIV